MQRSRGYVALGLLLLTLFLVGCGGTKPTASPTAPPAVTMAAAMRPAAAMMPMPMTTMMRADVPAKAYTTLHYIQTHNGDPPPGYVGGTIFDNRERRLPQGSYKEYDIDPKLSGIGRNAERLVINQGTGQAYYTGDHYVTFIPISAAP